MAMSQPCLTRDDYQIGIICALPVEKAAMEEMLDAEHFKLNTGRDKNDYNLGRIGVHNVVIACLPAGSMGIGPAAIVASNMERSFPIIFGLMVGIGGGVWSKKVDMRLGDIVVGQPDGQHGGVVQWDFGKTEAGGKFCRTGSQNKPPRILLNALQTLKTRHWKEESRVSAYLSMMYKKSPQMAEEFRHQGEAHDRLFKSTYDHAGDDSCDNCDYTRIVERLPARTNIAPRIHYGNIASGNQVMKHGISRDQIAKNLGVICFEMEAAGLDNFPCLVIRGICDYADSHKNKRWQPYAAATAAAFAKELLGVIDEQEVAKSQLANVNTSLIQRDPLVIEKCVNSESQQDLLDRISVYDHERVHRRLCRKRLQGTGQWFLEHPDFKKWLEAKGSPSLWCSGITVVDSAKHNSAESGNATVYFYCENEQRNMLKASDCLASFVRQLLIYLNRTHRPCPKEVQEQIWKFFGTKCIQPDFDDLTDIFIGLSGKITGTIFVIDGLDELDEDEAKKVLLVVKSLFASETRQSGSRIAIFSRDQIASHLKVPRFVPGTVHISTSNNIIKDIELYIEIEIERKSCVRELTSDPALIVETKQKLLEGASGMFLWVYLQLEALWDMCSTDGDIRHAIKNLPKDLEETYCRCLERINHGRQYTPKVLTWVSYAARPLHIDELREAVAFDTSDKAWDPDKLPDPAILIGCCANLVVQDATDKCIRFAHPSVRQFLESNQSDNSLLYPANPRQGELSCGEFCVAYLSFSNFGLQIERNSDIRLPVIPQDFTATQNFSGIGAVMFKISRVFTPTPDQTKKPVLLRFPTKPRTVSNREQYKFLCYAVENWATQTKRITRQSAIWDLFEQLAVNPNKSWNFHPWISSGQSQISYLHGLLGWSVKEQHKPLLEIVLASESQNSARNFFDAPLIGGSLPALHVASRLGFEDIVRLLLKVCTVFKTDGEGYTALHHSAEKGHVKVTRLLLNAKGAKVDTLSDNKDTPISLAAINGHDQIVSLLIGKRAKFKDKDGNNRTLLGLVAGNGHEAVVKLLLEKGATIETKDDEVRTPLLQAAVNGYAVVVELLLNWGANMEAKDNEGRMPLGWAAQRGHETVVKLLLERGADIEAKDVKGRTPLSVAVGNGHGAVVKLLLERGANIEAKDSFDRTPLSLAAVNGCEAVFKLLLEQRVNTEAEDSNCRTPLGYAVEWGQEAVVKLLLERGVNIEAKDGNGRTPLLVAVGKGRGAVVKLLLERGVDFEVKDNVSRMPLGYAAEWGQEAVVKLLLERGANFEAKDSYSRTSLGWAARSGHVAIVKLLLERGANIEAEDNEGRTPLWWAAQRGHETVVKLLLERGADIEAKDVKGWTPLSVAVGDGHVAVVKLLRGVLTSK